MKLSILAAGFVSFAMIAACGGGGDDNNGGASTGGSSGKGSGGSSASGGSSGGTGGASGAGGSGGGPDPSFKAVEPCNSEGVYATGSTVMFSGLAYTPKCLKVKAGDTVKFTGTFEQHPLAPSKMRGDSKDSASEHPIKETTTGTEVSFTFAKAGTYGFFCKYHGAADNGQFMAGAVWVTP